MARPACRQAGNVAMKSVSARATSEFHQTRSRPGREVRPRSGREWSHRPVWKIALVWVEVPGPRRPPPSRNAAQGQCDGRVSVENDRPDPEPAAETGGQVPSVERGEVTRALDELGLAGAEAVTAVFPLVYEELRRLAHRALSHERPDHTLSTTALVHEAYVKLSGLDRIRWKNRSHFLATSAQAMRRVLVNHARKRRSQKRGGGQPLVPLADGLAAAQEAPDELISLDEALHKLEAMNARQCRIVECRFFAGLSVADTAEALDVSEATVKRDWTLARAWLNDWLTR
jgi:RNA polymerase sigma factor (TIGR02999 family)